MNTMLTYNTNSKTGPVCGGRAVSIKIEWETGSRSNYSGTIKKISKGRKVTYANEHDDYYIIYNNGTLGICDVIECFKTLNPIKWRHYYL